LCLDRLDERNDYRYTATAEGKEIKASLVKASTKGAVPNFKVSAEATSSNSRIVECSRDHLTTPFFTGHAPPPGSGTFRTVSFLDCAIPSRTTALDSVGVNARRVFRRELAESALFPAVEEDVLDVEGVDMAWDVAKDCQTDIDEEVGTAARDHENANGRDQDGDEDDKKGGRCVRHCVLVDFEVSRTATDTW
jgi:hypothetical protein